MSFTLVYVVIITASVLPLVGIPLFLKKKYGFFSPVGWGLAAALSVSLGGYLVVIHFAMSIPSKSLLLVQEGEVVTIKGTFPKEALLWKGDERLQNAMVVSYALQKKTVISRLNPITDNPKVRRLAYSVIIEAFGSPTEYLVYRAATGGKLRLSDWLEFYLYEFNEKYSKELGIFYNPRDEEQQKNFQALLENFLEPYLKDTGVRFKEARFRLE